jgi:hypothetical protein
MALGDLQGYVVLNEKKMKKNIIHALEASTIFLNSISKMTTYHRLFIGLLLFQSDDESMKHQTCFLRRYV